MLGQGGHTGALPQRRPIPGLHTTVLLLGTHHQVEASLRYDRVPGQSLSLDGQVDGGVEVALGSHDLKLQSVITFEPFELES